MNISSLKSVSLERTFWRFISYGNLISRCRREHCFKWTVQKLDNVDRTHLVLLSSTTKKSVSLFLKSQQNGINANATLNFASALSEDEFSIIDTRSSISKCWDRKMQLKKYLCLAGCSHDSFLTNPCSNPAA